MYNESGKIISFLYYSGEDPYVYDSINLITYDGQVIYGLLKNDSYYNSIGYDNDEILLGIIFLDCDTWR
jgi:hypothetical protein